MDLAPWSLGTVGFVKVARGGLPEIRTPSLCKLKRFFLNNIPLMICGVNCRCGKALLYKRSPYYFQGYNMCHSLPRATLRLMSSTLSEKYGVVANACLILMPFFSMLSSSIFYKLFFLRKSW